MPTEIIKARVMNLNQTEQAWLLSDPVLLDGEVAYVRFGDLVKMKLGNGVSKFSELNYNLDGNGNNTGNIPTGQVCRYKSFNAVNGDFSLKGLFNKRNSLSSIYLFRRSSAAFTINIGTAAGSADLGTYEIQDATEAIDLVTLFGVDTDLYISGFSANNVCDILIIYNAFELNSDGSVPVDVIQDLRNEISTVKTDLETKITNLQNSMKSIPKGVVVPWPGPIDQIPEGWSLYTGFFDRFVIGAGGKYRAGDSGGSETVKLTVGQLPKFRVKYRAPKADGSASGNRDSHPDGPMEDKFSDYIGNDEAHENMPPYTACNFIIKD